MARPLRLEHAGALYHVTARGDRRENMFFENEDQSRADIVKKVLAEEGVTIRVAEGIGVEAFVAPNDTEEHKEKNRRVEVWVVTPPALRLIDPRHFNIRAWCFLEGWEFASARHPCWY